MKREEMRRAKQGAVDLFAKAGIMLTTEEAENIEIAEFGLNDWDRQGLAIVTYVNTERYCAKELVLLPYQTCPEHMHPPVGDDPGKMETFRCRYGKVYLCVEGEPSAGRTAAVPPGSEAGYTVFREIVLRPGEQFTISPGMLHWFQAGEEGAVISEFSSTSRDEFDLFTDNRIVRVPPAEAEDRQAADASDV